ncbi:MAG: aminoglycoside phosphotransferase family protein [Hyphomicrobiales bacterium]
MEQAMTQFHPDLDAAIPAFLREAGLVHGDDFTAVPLTGGVASDIWKIETRGRVFVVKKALARLRVAQVWEVPVNRNASEVAWLQEAAKVAPQAVPRILAHDAGRGVFAMDYLAPQEHPVWKSELAAGRADPQFAATLGATLASIHAATAGDDAAAQRFANDGNFHAIRLEPYIEAVARRHVDLAEPLLTLVQRTLSTKLALVHGDVSPKNILAGPAGPVFLDAECAWYGDPAFDLAFCLNHLLLKALWKPQFTDAYAACCAALSQTYFNGVTWEEPAACEARVATLLPALLLARVDGKSPVEYLTAERQRDYVRTTACAMIAEPRQRISEVSGIWMKGVGNHG